MMAENSPLANVRPGGLALSISSNFDHPEMFAMICSKKLQKFIYSIHVFKNNKEKLKNEKNLVITDDDFAVESLQNISYYALIGGYKHPFIDIHTRKYINEACFEDIVVLYEFDEELRGIFFKYLCRVERKMRSSISYHFCKKHGERQEEYLNSNNYGNIPKNKNGITKLIKMLDMMANKNKDHEYLVY